MSLPSKRFFDISKIISELKSFNFSVYGRWFGYINIILCFALGIANLFNFGIVILFAITAIVQGFIILFTEVPFLLKICPLSENFVKMIKQWNSNGMRTIFYLVMAGIQWVSLTVQVTTLAVLAIGLSISAVFYGTGYFAKQEFKGSNCVENSRNHSSTTQEAPMGDML